MSLGQLELGQITGPMTAAIFNTINFSVANRFHPIGGFEFEGDGTLTYAA